MFDVFKHLPEPPMLQSFRKIVAERRAQAEAKLLWNRPEYRDAVDVEVKHGAWRLMAGFGVHPRQLRTERHVKRAMRGMSALAMKRAAAYEDHANSCVTRLVAMTGLKGDVFDPARMKELPESKGFFWGRKVGCTA